MKNKSGITVSVLAVSLLIVLCLFQRNHILQHGQASQIATAIRQDSLSESPPGLGKDVIGEILNDIQQREYHVDFDGDKKVWQSPNRRQNIRSYYRAGEWHMKNRVDSIGYNWNLTFNTVGIYADEQLLAPSGQTPKTVRQKNQMDFEYPLFTEQYINSPEGVRQNFIIKEVPLGTSKVTVKLAFSGMEAIEKQSNEIHFTDGHHTLTYSGLQAWDATGAAVDALLHVNNDEQNLMLVAMVENATFPLTIDPIVANGNPTNADATLEANQANANFSSGVSAAGDVNGDGYSDVIVGAPNYDNGNTDEGAAFVYHGSATGIITTVVSTLEINQDNANFGSAVSNAGDVNNDGYSDVIVGAPGYDSNKGAAFIYHGSLTGISTTAATTIAPNHANANFGSGVSSAGDVDGDGYSDVIVGAPNYGNGQTDEGAAFVYHGSATGINSIATITLESNQGSALMGTSVSGAGDINGDGYSDVIVGVPEYDNGKTDEGGAFIYYGSSSVGIQTSGSTIVESNSTGANMGVSVSGAGDVNGDGYSDVIVGSHLYGEGITNQGAVFVYYGSSSGASTTAAIRLESGESGARMGHGVAGAGDVNGDGYSDVIVGLSRHSDSETNEGAAFIYHGSATGISSTEASSIKSGQNNAQLGRFVSGAGDVNGDGYSDIIVASHRYDNGETDEGLAFVYHGSAAGTVTQGDPSNADVTIESNQAEAKLGYSVSSAGDVNGDGYSDVIVGAYLYDNGQTDEGVAFIYHGSATGIVTSGSPGNADAMIQSNQTDARLGHYVSGTGDVNGDGYSDVIVGAYQYDNGQTDEGAAFVFYGSATGIVTSGGPANADAVIQSNQADARLGWCVSQAGDVNGDGYNDIIVAASQYTDTQSNEGAVFVFHGSASGIVAAGNPSNANAVIVSGQADADLNKVSNAGDVNGDGYDDIIIGATKYDNGTNDEGAAFVYHGSASGIATGDPSDANAIIDSDQADSKLGNCVSTAGDVNGDGYSDIIVGAYQYDKGEADEGIALVFHGSASGIVATGNPGNANAVIESNQVDANLARRTVSTKDLNADGYSDIGIGANQYDNGEDNEGSIFIYHGSADGIVAAANPNNADAVLESNQAGGRLGWSVSNAGDVNGDGYNDIIVGSYNYDNSETNEGAAFIYYGNQGGGLQRSLNLYNTGTSDPINYDNHTSDDFTVGIFVKNPEGRSGGKLVWETRSNSESFSSPLANSTQYTDLQASYTDLGKDGTELTQAIDKISGSVTYVRVRVAYDPVTSQNGQVYTPWSYFLLSGNNSGASVSSYELPVELLDFSVNTTKSGTIKVAWQTASETDNDYFTVERSPNASHWESVVKVEGAGNSSTKLSYQIIDQVTYQGIAYYRLKQTDFDGTFSYSEIKTVDIALSKQVNNILVYPNPAQNTIRLVVQKNQQTTIQCFDKAGKDLTAMISMKNVSDTQIELDISKLKPGLYLIKTPKSINKIYKQ